MAHLIITGFSLVEQSEIVVDQVNPNLYYTHVLKYVSCPNRLIANFYGPVEGRRHDFESSVGNTKAKFFCPDETSIW